MTILPPVDKQRNAELNRIELKERGPLVYLGTYSNAVAREQYFWCWIYLADHNSTRLVEFGRCWSRAVACFALSRRIPSDATSEARKCKETGAKDGSVESVRTTLTATGAGKHTSSLFRTRPCYPFLLDVEGNAAPTRRGTEERSGAD